MFITKPAAIRLVKFMSLPIRNRKPSQKSYSFGNKQTVIFSVRLEKDSTLKWQKYKVNLGSGGIIIPDKKGLAGFDRKAIQLCSVKR